ncbi:DUF362 domain-containing protein [Cyanobacterium aponinum UTEX 3222]|uniref:DUF362 domain-containing protein n=2 Tax=Cyanobacterium aponinum TaxID=379064 RepID=A0A844H1F5_9CHRO|nr:DUF362 domain-containing protein [Cyanobacterium aponinum]WRL43037.1 DUF362 domain-containing protein [Cyanobacterium aponinum UTEX 3222]MBD2394199.1 DUF362 domain-containing protein [Cyanobacterium aponinum FACHB-4101]MTF40016.1 DUF362 domain-containing protein [Cyanobacterium aponinum 0216]PHV62513.1 thylakoid-associated protein [Cyanobacterium aponinum IPPAS B-1201]WPF87674.1 DUF362 domain-containing protein [Cyanobacterium aponinum AL20115]
MTQVSLLKAQSYELQELRNSLASLLAPFGGMSAFVKKGDRVLLKPNLLTASRPTKECTTRKEIVYCVAQMVMEAGGKPFLGDSPAFGSAEGVAKANGYLDLCQELNLPIIEFNSHKYPVENENFHHLRLSKEAMEADVVINLPKIKSHMQLTMTMGVKNLFGCVPGKMKAWWHMEAGKDVNRFGEMLVETAKAIQPNLTIIDGIIAHEGNGPSAGEPRELGVLGASDDVFALDVAIASLLNVEPELVPTLNAQKRLGLCSELENIEFPLLKPQELAINDWKLPSALMPIDFGLPRVLRSTFKHLYIRFVKEPLL